MVKKWVAGRVPKNILAIVGFGAAMEAIKEFLDDGEWEYIEN